MKILWISIFSMFLLSSCVDNMEDLPEYDEQLSVEKTEVIKEIENPTNDSISPKLITQTVSGITQNSAYVVIEVDEDSSVQVEYGINTSYGNQVSGSNSLSKDHTVILNGLFKSAMYHYRLVLSDKAGNKTISGDFTFKTLADADQIAPIVSSLLPTGLLPSTTVTTTLSVRTNEKASCRYSTLAVATYDQMLVMSDTDDISHRHTVAGLESDKTYNYYVSCRDVAGNTSANQTINFSVNAVNLVGVDLYLTSCQACHLALNVSTKKGRTQAQIQTAIISNPAMKDIDYLKALIPAQVEQIALALAVNDLTAPIVKSQAASNTTQTTTSILISLDERADAQIEYGETVAYGRFSIKRTGLSSVHSIPLTALKANTTYHFRIISSDASGNRLVSSDYTFKTLAVVDVTAPILSMLAPSGQLKSGTKATNLSFVTNEKSSCKYSTSAVATYAQMVVMSTTGDSQHSQTVTGLTDDKNYKYYILCRDVVANTSQKVVIEFSIPKLNLDGIALYNENCMSCHLGINVSPKKNKSQLQIQNAINDNGTMKAVAALRALTPQQVLAISVALKAAGTPVGGTNSKVNQKYMIKTRMHIASKFKSIFVNKANNTEDRNISNIIEGNIEDNSKGIFDGTCSYASSNCPGNETTQYNGSMSATSSPGRNAIMYNTCTSVLLRDRAIQNALALAGLTVGSAASNNNLEKLFDVFYPGFDPNSEAINNLSSVHSSSRNNGMSTTNAWRMVMTPMCHSSLFEVF